MSISPLSSYVKTVKSIDPDELNTVTKTLRIWKRYFNYEIKKVTLDASSMQIASDFKLVLHLFQYEIFKIKHGCARKIFAVTDESNNIQAMSCTKAILDGSSCYVSVCQLLVAPWNLRLSTPLYHKPLRGGGIAAFASCVLFAEKIKAKKIILSSTPSGFGFYQKIGMKSEDIHVFTLSICPEDLGKFKEVFFATMAHQIALGCSISFEP